MANSDEGAIDRREFLTGVAAAAVSGQAEHAASEQTAGDGHAHEHDHGHEHEHQAVPSDIALRVRALETVLVEKGMVDPAELDAVVDTYENRIGPRNGARVVARAWVDPAYKQRLLSDATAAIGSSGTGARRASTW